MDRRTIRRLLIGLLVPLPIQYRLVGMFGFLSSELWPALVLPGFKGVLDDAEVITVSDVTFESLFADGSATSVPASTSFQTCHALTVRPAAGTLLPRKLPGEQPCPLLFATY